MGGSHITQIYSCFQYIFGFFSRNHFSGRGHIFQWSGEEFIFQWAPSFLEDGVTYRGERSLCLKGGGKSGVAGHAGKADHLVENIGQFFIKI